MEELTQVKFNKNVSRKYHLPNSILSEEGLMPAIWVSNVFLIKKKHGNMKRILNHGWKHPV